MEDDRNSTEFPSQADQGVQRKRRGKRTPKSLHASPCKRVRSVNEDAVDTPLLRIPQATQLDREDKELIAGLVTRVERMEATLLEVLAKLNSAPNFSSGFFFVPNNFVHHDMRAPVPLRGESYGREQAGNFHPTVRQRSDITGEAAGHIRADVREENFAEQVQRTTTSVPVMSKSTRSNNFEKQTKVISGAGNNIAEHVKHSSSLVDKAVYSSMYQSGNSVAEHVNHSASSRPVHNAGVSSSYVYQSRSPTVAGSHDAGHVQHAGAVANTVLIDHEYQSSPSMEAGDYVEQYGNETEGSEREASRSDSEEGYSSNESVQGSEVSEEERSLPGTAEVQKVEKPEFVVNGINVSDIASRNPYNYALRLMDVFFTKEEMAVSLLFKSKKSDKPALDKEKVERLLSCVEKRYGKEWDLKTLTAKANQKCRDSRDSLIIREV